MSSDESRIKVETEICWQPWQSFTYVRSWHTIPDLGSGVPNVGSDATAEITAGGTQLQRTFTTVHIIKCSLMKFASDSPVQLHSADEDNMT